VEKKNICLFILRFLFMINYSEFRSCRTLYKSVSIIRAKPIQSSTERKNSRVFSRYRGLLFDFLIPKGRRRWSPLFLSFETSSPFFERCGVEAGVVRVYIIKESEGKGGFQTHIPQSHEIPAHGGRGCARSAWHAGIILG